MNGLTQLGYMMSVERAEAFQALAKAVFDYLADDKDRGDDVTELGAAYQNLMEVVNKETNGEPGVQSTISDSKE